MGDCRFGYVEYDGDQYCFEHFGWRHYTDRSMRCDLAPKLDGFTDPASTEDA